jgi:hypothetical protein
MASEIVQILPQSFTSQDYKTQDVSLLSSFNVGTSLSTGSYIESFIYDNNKNILSSEYNFNQYTVLNNGQSAGNDNAISSIQLDPELILTDNGYSQGIYNLYLNFFNYQIGSNLQQLYITEISSDRTEIRLDSTSLTNADIVEQANNLIQQRESSSYFLDFYLNFGENQLAIANNIQLDNQDPNNPTILIKLYEALPAQFNLNSTLWIVTQIETPIAYQVTFEPTPIVIIDTTPVKGPNFNLDLKDQVNNSTISLDYTNLTTTTLTSSFNQLSSLLEEKEIDINIDYTDFNNFTHFSSVQARLENFYYKMSLLEDYSSSISLINTQITGSTSSSLVVSDSITIYESQINNIITNFDGYEYYLYYTSGSYAWPKTTSQPPYALAKTGSNAVLTWFGSSDENNTTYYGGISLSASIFDNLNQNNLYYSIPEYLREDPANEPYQIFVEMVGQFYDNIWIYYKDVTEKYNADNRLENGISKDIVADAIRDFGIKLYQNNFSNDDLYTAFLGLTPGGALFPFPNITGSLPTPSGFEYVNTLISASNDYIPLDDVNKSLYKRIYHNLPYLLKAKGTLPALRTLITSYGIPDTVLRITEYGGKDKVNSNDWDYWQDTFNYAYFNTGSNQINTNWVLNSNWNSPNNVPSTLEFRFKVPSLSTISGSASVGLWKTNTNSRIQLRYTGSGLTTGSYSGSIVDPYYQYTHLDFFPDLSGNPSLSASIYLPFSNEEWWSVMATRNGTNFTLYAGNNVYEGGENGTQLGFYATSSTTVSSTAWTSATGSQFMPQGTEMYLQEIRYYNTVLSESIFKDYIMNPYSSEGNSLNSSPNQLAFRLSMGGELYTGSRSIHPKITGSWIATSSFATDSTASFTITPTFIPNTEYFFYDQPVIGIKNAISDKIRLEDNTLPAGDTLSAIRALAQQPSVSSSYTPNTNLLEVAFSPQDEINDDIMSQIGHFNIGEYIGDPRLRSSSATSYPDLDNLRNAYFEKYTKNYDLNDFMRLIKFFDNSLFKMIKDFIPARTSLASGIVIKQHLLERNKYPQPQVEWEDLDISGTLKPTWNDYQPGTVEHFDGGAGGTMNIFNDPSFNYPPSIILDILEQDLYLTSETLSISSSATLTIVGNFFNETGDNPTECEIAYIPPTGPNQSLFYSNIPISTTEYFNITIPVQVGGQLLFTGFSSLDGVFLTTTVTSYPTPTNIYNLNQSWYESIPTISGSVIVLHNSQDEFYDGEFSGSTLVVTTQSLAQAYPLENFSFDYTPVRYSEGNYGFLNDLSDDPNPPTAQNQFLNSLTVPNQGEILLLRPYFILGSITPGGGFIPSITGPAYAKMHKFDNNGVDNTIPLGQANKILIKYSTLSNYSTLNILTVNEYPSYYLYEVNTLGSNTEDNYILNYQVSASRTTPSFTLTPGDSKAISSLTESIDNLGYFNPVTGVITFQNTPNITIHFSASLSLNSSGNANTSSLVLIKNGDITDEFAGTSVSSTTFILNSGANTVVVTGSFYPLAGDNFYLRLFNGTTPFDTSTTTFNSVQLKFTQSIAPSAKEFDPIIIEPYITLPNYYNSDFNPLINNTEGERLSAKYQDVDYSSGITTPTNFALLISGSAVKAAIQDSNYSSKRVIIPRYEGSKSTSQVLNAWSPGDIGTYGKIPTVDSLKTAVAYCDSIGGWPPERENASAIFVKYLIKADGTVVIPNTSENSLADIKGNFESGENVLISTKTVSAGQPQQSRKIIRGGSRIEPILYTQYGQAPNVTWNTTMSFTDVVPSNNGAVGNYTSLFKRTANTSNFQADGTQNTVSFTNAVYGSSLLSGGGYIVTSLAIADGVSLTFNIRLVIRHQPIYAIFPSNFTDTIYLYKGSSLVTQSSNPITSFNLGDESTISMTYNIPTTQLSVGDIYTVKVSSTSDTPTFEYIRIEPTGDNNQSGVTTQWNTSQYPAFTLPVTSSGTNSIWNWPDSASYPYVITSSQTTLVNLYGDPNVKMADITGSGFNPVESPWSIKYGDEFKFEGREDFVYQVGKIFGPAESGSGRLFQTGSIEVHFNANLPISASPVIFNLDHFAIRRYADDASQVIMEGFRPTDSSGPYIVRPEFVVPELNKSVDQFILDLTQKGLIT